MTLTRLARRVGTKHDATFVEVTLVRRHASYFWGVKVERIGWRKDYTSGAWEATGSTPRRALRAAYKRDDIPWVKA